MKLKEGWLGEEHAVGFFSAKTFSQFYQHYIISFFVQKCFYLLFSTYSLAFCPLLIIIFEMRNLQNVQKIWS